MTDEFSTLHLIQINVRVESVTKYSEPDGSMEIDGRGPFGMKYTATHGSQGINEQKNDGREISKSTVLK